MSLLPTDQKHVVELKFFQHFTFDEISGQLGISSNTAKSRLYAALKKMREQKGTMMMLKEGA
jgi:RNA polymerase sigma-70 factor (ECF subfamily)